MRGRSACGSDACPGISSGRSIEQLQVGNVAADHFSTFLGLVPDHRMRGGLCGNEEFERASTEARFGSEGSRWLEIIVHGKLGKNNAGRLAAAKQARAAHHSSAALKFRLQFGSA